MKPNERQELESLMASDPLLQGLADQEMIKQKKERKKSYQERARIRSVDERAALNEFFASNPELNALNPGLGQIDAPKEQEPHFSQAKNILQPIIQPARLEVYKASDLKKMDLKPPECAIDGLLPAGLAILAAPPKTGKSWLCIDIACAVATGESFWGYRTQQGTVLYLDLESKQYRVKDRFEKMRIDPPEALSIAHDANRIDTGLIEQLKEWIDHADKPRLIIIDTFGRIKGSGKRGENSYDADTRILGPLQKLATDRGLAVLLVTHLRKAGAVSADDPFERITGSNGQFGVADTAWMISGKRSGEEKQFLITSRDFGSGEHTIVFNKELFRWQMLGDSSQLTEQRKIDEYRGNLLAITIRTIIKERGGSFSMRAGELITEMANRHGDTQGITSVGMRKKLRVISPFMLKYDGIVYHEPSSASRRYEFALRDNSFI